MSKNEIKNIHEYNSLITPEEKVLYEIISDKMNKFKIRISNNNNNLNIQAFYEINFSNIIFEKDIDLQEIQEKKLFYGFQNIDEYIKGIYTGINSGKGIINEEKDEILLIIPLNDQEIKFKLIKKNKEEVLINDNYDINNIYEFNNNSNKYYNYNFLKRNIHLIAYILILFFLIIIFLVNSKINSQKSTINYQNNQMNNLTNYLISFETQIKLLENQIISYHNEVKSLKNSNEKLKENINKLFILEQKQNGLSLDSKIINDYKNYTISLKNWISSSKYISSKLLYRLSEDGKNQYHNKCDDIYQTLTLVETNEGYSFGGFTPCNLKNIGNQCFEIDNGQSFLFFLNSNKKVNYYNDGYERSRNRGYSKSNSNCTKLDSGYIYFYSNLDKCKLNGKYSSINNNYISGINLNNDFTIKEIEVFEINIEDNIN